MAAQPAQVFGAVLHQRCRGSQVIHFMVLALTGRAHSRKVQMRSLSNGCSGKDESMTRVQIKLNQRTAPAKPTLG